jgi:SOS-response transcriptional repressor LexA
MIPFDEIDSRLALIGKNRAWLVEVTGRSENSIRASLAPSAPDSKRSDLLQKALSDAIEKEESAQRSSARLPDQLALAPTADEFNAWCRAYKASEAETLKDWAIDELNKAAAAWKASKVSQFPVKAHILAAAGPPILSEVMDWDGDDDTVMVRITGLSMAPVLNDGDVIPMRHKKISRNPFMKKGLIYLVEYDGGYTVKRYNTRPATPEEKGEEWVERGKVKVLESINPEFPEIIIKQPLEWVAWLDQ